MNEAGPRGTPQPADPVLLYDGECGLCNRLVRRLLQLDRQGRIRFASLQGPSGQAFLQERGLPTQDFSTLVFVSDWKRRSTSPYFLRTDGVVQALQCCGKGPRIAGSLLNLVPRFLRDGGYRLVARIRYRLFGPWKACPLPRPEWAKRFID